MAQDLKVSQDVTELLVTGEDNRVSQDVTELLVTALDNRVSQDVTEFLTLADQLRISQDVTEFLVILADDTLTIDADECRGVAKNVAVDVSSFGEDVTLVLISTLPSGVTATVSPNPTIGMATVVRVTTTLAVPYSTFNIVYRAIGMVGEYQVTITYTVDNCVAGGTIYKIVKGS